MGETALGTDRLKAAAGGEHAKNRLGVLKSGGIDRAGPVDFPCRFKGKKGHAYITSTATTPALSWTTEKEDVDPVFSIAISDIQESKEARSNSRLWNFGKSFSIVLSLWEIRCGKPGK